MHGCLDLGNCAFEVEIAAEDSDVESVLVSPIAHPGQIGHARNPTNDPGDVKKRQKQKAPCAPDAQGGKRPNLLGKRRKQNAPLDFDAEGDQRPNSVAPSSHTDELPGRPGSSNDHLSPMEDCSSEVSMRGDRDRWTSQVSNLEPSLVLGNWSNAIVLDPTGENCANASHGDRAGDEGGDEQFDADEEAAQFLFNDA